MEKYVSPDIQAMKRDFDIFLTEADNFIKKVKSYENRK